jgi:electron transfer flavoprotein beta subunit
VDEGGPRRRAAVLVKAVPVGGQSLRVVDGQLVRDGVPHGIDPLNEVGLELALAARRSGALDEVVAVSMGPESAADALRRALAAGADDVLHVADAGLAGADVRRTADVLAAAVRRLDACLAVFGYESADGSSGVVPSAVAALLDWPLVSRVRHATVDSDVVTAERDLGIGPEVAVTRLPAVLSVVDGAIEPAYPTLKQVLRAKHAELPVVTLDDLGTPSAEHRPGERVVGLRRVATTHRQPVVLSLDEGLDLLTEELRDVAPL